MKLFTRVGWFCVPSSIAGFVLCALAAGFCVTVFVAVDRAGRLRGRSLCHC